MRSLLFIASLLLTAPAFAQADADTFSDAQILEAAIQAIEARLPGASERLEITVLRTTTTRSDAVGQPTVKLPKEPVVPRGRVQVAVSAEGELAAWAMLQIAHFDSVATLPASLSGGAPVSPSELRFVWMETTRFSGDPLTPREVAGWADQEIISRRSLRADKPLRTSDVGPRPAADTGDPIRMTYRRASFVLELSCRARDRGLVGDTIRLYADDSDTVYRARLTGPGTAVWLETLER